MDFHVDSNQQVLGLHPLSTQANQGPFILQFSITERFYAIWPFIYTMVFNFENGIQSTSF